jgi:hypothetical protein
MDDFCAHGQFAEGVRQHDRQLKTEQGLRARYQYKADWRQERLSTNMSAGPIGKRRPH